MTKDEFTAIQALGDLDNQQPAEQSEIKPAFWTDQKEVQKTLWELLQAYNDGQDRNRVDGLLETLRRFNASTVAVPRVVYLGGDADAWLVGRSDRMNPLDE